MAINVVTDNQEIKALRKQMSELSESVNQIAQATLALAKERQVVNSTVGVNAKPTFDQFVNGLEGNPVDPQKRIETATIQAVASKFLTKLPRNPYDKKDDFGNVTGRGWARHPLLRAYESGEAKIDAQGILHYKGNRYSVNRVSYPGFNRKGKPTTKHKHYVKKLG